MTNNFATLLASTLLIVSMGSGAIAGTSSKEAGVLVCVTDKWDEKEPEKGHKLVDMTARCVAMPDDPAGLRYSEECAGKYEFMPDGTFKASGSCTYALKNGDKIFDTFEEGSHLKESTYKITGGTGAYQNASGGGTYSCDILTDTLCGGRYKGTIQTP
ncbi:MAG: hypothetical protein AB7S74_14030 [Hyphomicrobium sp.]